MARRIGDYCRHADCLPDAALTLRCAERRTSSSSFSDKGSLTRCTQPDKRDSHFWFALYWAEALAAQSQDTELAAHFASIAEGLKANADTIVAELQAGRGSAVDTGGYYNPDSSKLAQVMRPSATLNQIIG